MAITNLDIRQSVYRNILQHLFPYLPGQTVDLILESIDSDLTSPLEVTATSTPSLVVNIGPSVVSNPESSRNRSVSFVNSVIPQFTSGTVTVPSSDGGTITASTGATLILNLPVGNYVQLLLALDTSGNIQMVLGSPNPTLTSAAVPTPLVNTLPFAYVTLYNNSGTVQNITQSAIFQITGEFIPPAPSAGTGPGWTAKEIALGSGLTEYTYFFPTPQVDNSYVPFAIMENLTDANPQFQQIEITAKTTTSFTVQWNMPLDTANYILSLIVPPKDFSVALTSIGSGLISFNDPTPLIQPSITYPTIAIFQNTVDLTPRFQTIVATNKTTSTVTLSWNDITDSANYQAIAMFNATTQQSVSSGVQSTTITLPVDYGTTGYGIIVTTTNVTDANPKFQPLLITAKTTNTITVSWPDLTESANYVLTCYAVSLTS